MAWPPTNGVTAGYTVTGITTIRWGTDGLLQSPKPNSGYYVVQRFGQRELAEPIKLTNGTGLTVTRVILLDGSEFTITVRDDTQMTPPAAGDVVRIVDGAGILGSVGSVYSATVTANSYDSAPKQAGERVLTAEHLTLIEGNLSNQGGAQS